MPPTNLPVHPGGLLAETLDTWRRHGWDLDTLASFRMDGGDGGGGDDDGGDDDGDDLSELESLSDDELDALESLSDDDAKKLRDLPPDKRAELTRYAQYEARIRAANKESADRRRELKPWKAIAREFGMTADEVREALAKAKTGKGGSGKGGKDDDAPDPDEIRREAQRDASRAADRRIIRSEVKRLAADVGFIDPRDALSRIDLDDYELDDDGDIDEDQVREDLKRVLEKAPHLKKARKRPKPDGAQGRRGDPKSAMDAGRAEAERRFGKQKAATATK